MIYAKLITEFFKIGLFSFGGGYATLPFLYHISTVHGWYSIEELKQMLAVASITPGPVGLNIATYAGIKTAGLIGAFCATVSEMLPALILVAIVAKILTKFSENFYIKAIVEGLKPISCALLISVAVNLVIPSITDLKAMFLLTALLLISVKSKKSPLFYILLSALAGVSLTFII